MKSNSHLPRYLYKCAVLFGVELATWKTAQALGDDELATIDIATDQMTLYISCEYLYAYLSDTKYLPQFIGT